MTKDWDDVLIEAAIAAMQGIQESGKAGLAADMMPEKTAKMAMRMARCLVAELRKEIPDI